ncbi:DNA-binding CsgD family transcriptional regulator/tetratricopeptide (TPR) repeat protein [Kitasatospora kifunensis]|uniref:DNA-binding CsgD family transcriptional regulator/tetratricopeptide (TPR) repeat protein n=1 Tax=Kitasatospora kifunensis TaxID=58351 RepID=A0A7W7R1A6_KITKI|nr:AAA family ATPase [Kitasatospora kifunensis]MBB4923419.1 DNA-binding CsgD family transcriptional regulator/tetratricopeptide (TPR) repeat protein [Kitasatospora kifunensis]
MEQISVSPVFVGRGSEIASLTKALRRAAAGQPQALLVGGEAGVGKTRLLEEFLCQAERDGQAERQATVTMLGNCLEVGATGLPYAPMVTALRRLYRRLGPELEQAAAGMEGHLSRLLPEFGEADTEPNDEYGRARLFEHIARLFERLSVERTLVLAIEDLHWSDRSTRELLSYLISTLHRSRVLILATYRTDDLHRRHPLRPFLAELERQRTVHRLELDRFGQREVAAQLAGILGIEVPDRQLVARIHRRSEGNPFFVEELACSHQEGCSVGLSDSLRDILLVRVEALPEQTQRVLRIAAEGGSRIEHQLLEAVLASGREAAEDDLLDALRTAVGANILQPDKDGEGYRFRHALVREAVSDDLLPGERTRINRRFAEALEADPGLVGGDQHPARLANYWYHAHDPARALPSALDAARAARRRNAFAEQLSLLERAIELWDEVGEETLQTTLRPHDWAETYPPCCCEPPDCGPECDRLRLVDVLAEAVVAARRAGDRDRGLSLAKRALKLVDEAENPLRAAWFRMNRARMLGHLNRLGGDQELAHARRLVESTPPSAVKADVYGLAAGQALLHHPTEADLEVAEQAVAIARQVGARSVELHAQMTLGSFHAEFGDPEHGIAVLREAIEGARRLDVPDLLTRGLNNLASLFGQLGRAEEGVEAAREGLAVAGDVGLLRNAGALLAGNLAECLLQVGRPAEAAQVLAGWEGDGRPEPYDTYLFRLRGELALHRGEQARAEEFLALARVGDRHQPQHAVPNAVLEIELAARAGHPLQARAALLAALAGPQPGRAGLLLPLLARAAGVEADTRGLPAADPQRPEVLRRIAAELVGLRPLSPLHQGWLALAEAELARATGSDTPAHWAAAIEPLRGTGLPYPLVLALLGAAGAAAAAGERERAGELLREAGPLAGLRGDLELGREIARLAERAGVARVLRPAAPGRADRAPGAAVAVAGPVQGAAAFHLTPRETDVLRLLTEGRTNRQIAEELFISPKTASVHVSNILAKLEVSGRGEAAALAHRLRLFPEPELLPAVGGA